MSQQINLFNPAFRKQKKLFSAATMGQALAAVFAGVLGIYAFEVYQNRTLQQVFAESDRQLVAQRDQMLTFSRGIAPKGNSKTLAEELALTEERLRARRGLLSEVQTGAGGNAKGFSSYLVALARRTMPGVWLTGVEVGGKSNGLVIKGRVLDSGLVPAYIAQLKREEPFAGRSVSELRLTAKEAAPPATPQAAREPKRFVEFQMSIPL